MNVLRCPGCGLEVPEARVTVRVGTYRRETNSNGTPIQSPAGWAKYVPHPIICEKDGYELERVEVEIRR